jgi:RNA polymerase sigma factor (sigma-70 family)
MSPHQLLTDRQVANTVCGTLLANGIPRQDVQGGLREVYIRALRFFRLHEAPQDLYGMKAFCATVARNYAIDQHRKASRRRADLAAKCKRAEYGWVEQEPVTRDPVDADRQLEVLADLFRENRMPEHGVEILEGVVSKCRYEEIGQDLGITADAVERRMRTMRKALRMRMARLGLLPQMQPLLVLLRNPSAVPMLREAA